MQFYLLITVDEGYLCTTLKNSLVILLGFLCNNHQAKLPFTLRTKQSELFSLNAIFCEWAPTSLWRKHATMCGFRVRWKVYEHRKQSTLLKFQPHSFTLALERTGMFWNFCKSPLVTEKLCEPSCCTQWEKLYWATAVLLLAKKHAKSECTGMPK